METKRKKAVVKLIPYNQETNGSLYLQGEYLSKVKTLSSTNLVNLPQHLFVCANDEIKAGDWYVFSYANVNKVFKCKSKKEEGRIKESESGLYSKIIATTDKILELPTPSIKFVDLFVKQYNKDVAITEVEVEYISISDDDQYNLLYGFRPKVNNRNEIAIYPIKLYIDKTEMFENMQYYMEYCKQNGYVTPQDWLENHKQF